MTLSSDGQTLFVAEDSSFVAMIHKFRVSTGDLVSSFSNASPALSLCLSEKYLFNGANDGVIYQYYLNTLTLARSLTGNIFEYHYEGHMSVIQRVQIIDRFFFW
jgi:hypothetical protein